MPVIKEYSPNTRWGKQIVEIVLKQWAYSKTFTIEVGGNCTGMDVLECAIDILTDQLEGEVVLKSGKKTLLVEDEEERDEEWVKDMVVSIQIVDWKRPTLNEIRAKNGADPLPDGDKPWDPM